MKSKGSLVWFAVSLTLGVLLAVQIVQSGQQKRMIEELRVEIEAIASNARATPRLAQRSEAVPPEALTEKPPLDPIDPKAPSPVALVPRFPNPPAEAGGNRSENNGSGGMMHMLGNMMKDPEMRKALSQQQKMGLNMAYGTLFKQMQLTPEQEEKFKETLLDQQMSSMSQAGALMEAGGNREEITRKLTEEQKARETQLKELVGEEKYTQYQDYTQTLGERMLLEQFGKDIQTTPEQHEQLLGLMREEKKNVQINTGVDYTKPENAQAAMGNQEAAERVFKQQEEVNARVLERAGEVLTAEQVRKLEPVLKTQLDMQRASIRMAREMFGGKPPATEPGQ